VTNVDDVEIYHPKHARVDEPFKKHLEKFGIPIYENDIYEKRFSQGDVVVVNTSGYPAWFFDDLLTNLENGTIKHLYWYLHEDKPEWISTTFSTFEYLTPDSPEDVVVHDRYKNIKQRFAKVISDDKVTIYAPSEATKNNWQKYFGANKNFDVMPGRVMVGEEDFVVRKAEDFSRIDFVINGATNTRKGQLSVVEAMISFYHTFYVNDSKKYRDFSLNIIGLDGELNNWYEDFLRNATRGLQENIKLYNKRSQDDVYKLLKKFNFTIMYSIAESFPLAPMEGMAFGHPIIRNESSGQKEQLKPGVNGWPADTKDWWGLVETIEEVLNKSKTSNEKLAKMSAESVQIAQENIGQKYQIIDEIKRELSLLGSEK
jgi:glycosyltransferase involved in cell wall biosynthesis